MAIFKFRDKEGRILSKVDFDEDTETTITIPEGTEMVTDSFFSYLIPFTPPEPVKIIFPNSLRLLECVQNNLSDFILDFSNCTNLLPVDNPYFRSSTLGTVYLRAAKGDPYFFDGCEIGNVYIKSKDGEEASYFINNRNKRRTDIENLVYDEGIKVIWGIDGHDNNETYIRRIQFPTTLERFYSLYFKQPRLTSYSTPYKGYKAAAINVDENGNRIYTCRDVPIELNKKPPVIKDLSLCESGYHYCKRLTDIFKYYCGKYDYNFIIFTIEPDINLDSGADKTLTTSFLPTKILSREEVIEILNKENTPPYFIDKATISCFEDKENC